VTCFLFLCIYVDKTYWPRLIFFKYFFELCPWQQGLLALKQNSIPFDCHYERGLNSLVYTGSTLQFLASICLLFLLLVHTCSCLYCAGCAMFRNRGISVPWQYIHPSEREDLILILSLASVCFDITFLWPM